MQPKAMLDGFEETLNSPAFGFEPDQVHPRLGISGNDKAQFLLTFGSLEPKPRDGERVGDAF